MTTITINLTRKLLIDYFSLGERLQTFYRIANDGFDNDVIATNGAAISNSSTPDGVTFFSDRATAEAYQDSQAWIVVLGNLNSNTWDPQAGNYVQGSFVTLPVDEQSLFDAKENVTDEANDIATLTTAIASKVDKATGFGLSTNDYDNTAKAAVNALGTASTHAATDFATPSSVTSAISTAINGVVGGADSFHDTLVEIQNIMNSDETTAAALMTTVSGKVDKITGKGLSTNDYTTAEKTKLAGLSTVGKMISGITEKDNSFPYLNHATIASGACVFQLTADGTSTGAAIFPTGVDADSINFFVNDSGNVYTFSYVLSNSNKTLTVTAKIVNLLALGLSNAANGTVVKLLCLGN